MITVVNYFIFPRMNLWDSKKVPFITLYKTLIDYIGTNANGYTSNIVEDYIEKKSNSTL